MIQSPPGTLTDLLHALWLPLCLAGCDPSHNPFHNPSHGQDMMMSAAQGPPEPMYSMPVPDRSAFVYERDTPLMPMQTGLSTIRESMVRCGRHAERYHLHR